MTNPTATIRNLSQMVLARNFALCRRIALACVAVVLNFALNRSARASEPTLRRKPLSHKMSSPPRRRRAVVATTSATDRRFQPRWWDRGDSNCRSSLWFLALTKGSKFQRIHCSKAESENCSPSDVAANSGRKRPDFCPFPTGESQRGPPFRIPPLQLRGDANRLLGLRSRGSATEREEYEFRSI